MADPQRKPANPFASLAALRQTLPTGVAPTPPPAPMPVDPCVGLWSRRMVVSRERKGRGGKTVAIVRFPDGADTTALEALAVMLRKALGTAAFVEGVAVVVQGDLVDRTLDCLKTHGATRVVRGTG